MHSEGYTLCSEIKKRICRCVFVCVSVLEIHFLEESKLVIHDLCVSISYGFHFQTNLNDRLQHGKIIQTKDQTLGGHQP